MHGTRALLLFLEGKYDGEEHLGTWCKQSDIAHRVPKAINDVRHQQLDEFLIRISNWGQTVPSSVFCQVLHFLIAGPCEAILRNWRLKRFASASPLRSFSKNEEELPVFHKLVNGEVLSVREETKSGHRPGSDSRTFAYILWLCVCLFPCDVQCLGGIRIVRIESQNFAQFHNCFLPTVESAKSECVI
jgi:hypothetical protein